MKSVISFVESRKFYAALIGAALQLVALYVQPLPEWYGIVVAFATALGVYVVPNSTPAAPAPIVSEPVVPIIAKG